jgi:hypothetical protein
MRLRSLSRNAELKIGLGTYGPSKFYEKSSARSLLFWPKKRQRTWQGRLPQELRLAGIGTVEEANQFLRDRHIAEFNGKFTVAAKENGTAFRKTPRSDLDWIFTVQNERVLAKDNTVTMAHQVWQIGKTPFRSTLAGCTVTIHEHLDGNVSMRYGPHVVGRFDAEGGPLKRGERGGKGGTPPQPQAQGSRSGQITNY